MASVLKEDIWPENTLAEQAAFNRERRFFAARWSLFLKSCPAFSILIGSTSLI